MFPVDIWSTVGQWVGSLLTGGSLLLGYRILRVDQKDKRRAQAAKVTFTATSSLDIHTRHVARVSGVVFNHSDALVSNAGVAVIMEKSLAKKRFTRTQRILHPLHRIVGFTHIITPDGDIGLIQPGESWPYALIVEEVVRVRPEQVRIKLFLSDANGVVWNRQINQNPVEYKEESQLQKRTLKAVLSYQRVKARALRSLGSR